ncbi:MAG: homocysteine S-methyltransferase family protein [Verrucomicrobiae bacterium]|nr:homocysteine S-methyltransferase family protein [Verrucomicrobiae bacterium]MDW8343256.1 homocysteine S-methyltransferase family protein [Verrucomicrobiae bacterium]
MNTLIAQMIQRTPVITDGAWGTQLQARGLEVGQCPDVWNLTHPERVEEVARAYVEAGSQIILTNTFGANRIRLAETGFANRVREINEEGVRISKRAAGTRALVFASMGPTGKMLVAGEVEPEEVAAAFAEQAEALKEGGANGIVVETMAELEEAQLAVRAAKATGLPVVACMVFDTGGRTMMGVAPEQAAISLAEAGADVIGSNCGSGIADFVPICRQLRAATTLPIWIKPNAGLPQMVEGQVQYRTTPQEFASYVPALIEAGANFLGGCCGTTPAHIAALRK